MKKATSVFYISAIVAILFIVWGTLPDKKLPANADLDTVTTAIQGFFVDKLGWFYLMSAAAFVVFSLYLIFSKYGNIKLGRPGDKPEYSYITWFAMLFSAGIGIGLVFWGLLNQYPTFMNRHMVILNPLKQQKPLCSTVFFIGGCSHGQSMLR